MKLFNIINIYYVLIALCVAKNAYSQSYSQGMGSSGASMVSPSGAALLNPALLSYLEDNHMHLFYDSFQRHLLPNGSKVAEKMYGINIIDTQTSELFPGAFTFAEADNDVEGYEARIYKLSFGRREYTKVSFGFALQRYEFSIPGVEESEHDVNLGITYSPTERLGFSFVLDNLTSDENDHLKKYYTLAVHYIYDPFMKLSLDLGKRDLHHDDSQPDIKSGISIPIGVIDINFGYANIVSENTEFFTGGLLWNGPRLGISYAYRDLLGRREGDGHFIDIGLFF